MHGEHFSVTPAGKSTSQATQQVCSGTVVISHEATISRGDLHLCARIAERVAMQRVLEGGINFEREKGLLVPQRRTKPPY